MRVLNLFTVPMNFESDQLRITVSSVKVNGSERWHYEPNCTHCTALDLGRPARPDAICMHASVSFPD